MKSRIQLSLAIPTFNGAHHLKKQFEKIFKECDKKKFQNFIEIVISDNASTDNTQKVISEMSGKIDEMEAEQEHLQEANIELKAKVAKPKYASFGTIERLENFAMTPMGAALNRNKLYLGNAKPTLLKFKPREEKENDN